MSASSPEGHDPLTCRAREVLDLVADKWSLYVVASLGDGPRRFTELKRAVEGISQRMLTVTLRGLERDGILTRTVYEVMPPHVTYRLTPLGESLLQATTPLIEWSIQHLTQIDAAHCAYDQRIARAPKLVDGRRIITPPMIPDPHHPSSQE
jgi:DNA-binding HxlR family transcriptional regulator